MLNKVICKLCNKEYYGPLKNYSPVLYDDDWDNHSLVWCPKTSAHKDMVLISIRTKPPDNCPYILEQTLAKEHNKHESI